MIPDEISQIHAELKSRSKRYFKEICPDAVYLKKIIQIRNYSFVIRAFAISDPRNLPSVHFLVLVDKLFVRSKTNLAHGREYYHLSLKEFEVVRCLADGLTNKEIGRRLHIAESTAKEYLCKVMRKVGASTRCGVVAQVLSIPDQQSVNGASNGK